MARAKKNGDRYPGGKLKPPSKAEQKRALRTLVEKRCRELGVWPAPNERLPNETQAAFEARERARDAMIDGLARTVTLPWFGCQAGRAIAGEDDVQDLWQVIQTIRQRRAAYIHALKAPNEHAAITRLGDAPTPGEELNDEPVIADIRDYDERARADIEKWREIVGIWGAGSGQLAILHQTIILDKAPPFQFAGLLRKVQEKLSGQSEAVRTTGSARACPTTV